MLNRDQIKYIAVILMALNHIANIFLKEGTVPFLLLRNLGYFTAPVMCYFLVEGYYYTHSRKQYGQRLLLFALLGPAILDELLADGVGMLAALLAAGNLSFWLCDRAVGALTRYYRLILKKKLKFLH